MRHLQDVAVSVVGKYRYTLSAPREQRALPLLVDIILVGRTKIITLHSAVWLDNATDRPLSFRLHVPLTPLTAPPPPQGTSPTDLHIGPLKPRGGGCSAPAQPCCRPGPGAWVESAVPFAS